MQSDNRPLSPHLQIYRPQLTSVLSITHRATGVFLSLGAFVLVAWISAAAGSQEQFENFQALAGSLVGKLVMLAWTYSLVYHLLNGVRHLGWDAGKGLEIEDAYTTGWLVVVVSIVATAGIWWLALGQAGGGS